MLLSRAVVNLQTFKRKASDLTVAVGRVAKHVERKITAVAHWRVPHYSRWGLYPQAIFIVVALVWFEYRPEWAVLAPSVAMCFLAVAAIVMALRGPHTTRIEGAVWIVVSCGLFVIEMHAIATDRKAHDAEQAALVSREETTRREQNRSFAQLIADGANLFKALGEEKELTQQNLEHTTGGNGYCWVVPMAPLPVGLGGNPAYQGDNWWQLGLKNSGKVVLPTCDLRFMPSPTEQEIKTGIVAGPLFLSYHFEKVPVMPRREYRPTSYFIKGDRIYSGVIETPTHSFIEVIKFEPDPNNHGRYVPKCTVTAPSEKVLENECNPQ
jgi:hypothetical protein